MKSRTSLVLIELVLMLLIFSLAAALCLQAFAWGETTSLEELQKDQALHQLQNAAEILKATRGEGPEEIFFNENWTQVQTEPAYILRQFPLESDVPGLGIARLEMTKADGTLLAELTVSWQEVSP